MALHAYSLFGLHLHSAIELPELQAIAPLAVPDVVIMRGSVDIPSGLNQLPQPIDDGLAIRVDAVATYAIQSGSSIIVDAVAGAAPRNVRLYLLGSAIGMLLHQRGILPLHANAVEIDGRAFAFMGASGAGKSTLAAWFYDRGHAVLSDDVCIVRFADDGSVQTSNGLPRLRLWREAVERSGRDPASFAQSYSGDATYDKFDVAMTPPIGGVSGLSLAAIYLLATAEVPIIRPLVGLDAVEALFANTYRGAYVVDTSGQRQHWQACVDLAARVPLFVIERHWGHDHIGTESVAILDHARHI